MKSKTDTMWARLIKHVLPANWWNRPAPNIDRNSDTLSRLTEDDPTFNCILDHAFAQFSNDLAITLDPGAPSDQRLAHADAAAGLRRFIEDMEYRRAGWNDERIRAEREAQKKKA